MKPRSSVPTTVKSESLVEKKRKQIVLAAIKLFSQKGFHKATLRDLAKEAGLTHANIYDYVGNKEDILFLVHEFLTKIVNEYQGPIMERIGSPLEKLRHAIRAEFDIQRDWADAALLIYREAYILNKDHLKKLLENERRHTSIFENIIEECINKGVFRECNIRAAANLIKIMIDASVLKRWDLRTWVSQQEMENLVFDITFHGLSQKNNTTPQHAREMQSLEGKSALVVNAGTELGRAISSLLISKGVRVAIYKGQAAENYPSDWNLKGKVGAKIYSAQEHGPITGKLIDKIINEVGFVDILIHDLAIDDCVPSEESTKKTHSERLKANLDCANDIAVYLGEKVPTMTLGRILYLAPWAWDRDADPFHYDTVKAGTVALTHLLARDMAPYRVSVNCVIPGFIERSHPSKIEKERALELAKELPFAHLGQISDINEAVLSGQILEVTGGMN